MSASLFNKLKKPSAAVAAIIHPSAAPAARQSSETAVAASNAITATPPAQGLITILVNSANGLTPPASVSSGPKASRKELPYLVLEFDKNQVVIDSVGGEVAAPIWGFKGDFDVSRASEVSLSIYLRSGSAAQADSFLGGIKFTPDLSTTQAVSDSWYLVVGGSGQVHIKVVFQKATQAAAPLTIEAFELLKVIGKGSFGKVMQVRKRDTSRIYALKTLRKAHIVSRSEVVHTLAERTVLAQVNSPFIVNLKFSFQSKEKLYLVLAFVNGGELFHHLQREGRFSEERSRFYAAELLLALEHLHEFNVVYRDLKPENILIDYTGHIALCDFGLCKLNMGVDATTNTFCGTPEYLAPELLLNQETKGYNRCIDWWTLGVLLYEMLSGLPPFYDENTNEMYRKILNDPLRFSDDFSAPAKDLLTKLLNRDPAQRLGANGATEIKEHPFFANTIDWKKLAAKQIRPPFKPDVQTATDTSNFDIEFTSEMPHDSVHPDSFLSESMQEQFKGFTFSAPSGFGSVVEKSALPSSAPRR